MLKYKEFEDEEFEICGFHEGRVFEKNMPFSNKKIGTGDWTGCVIWECWYNKKAKLKFSAKQRGIFYILYLIEKAKHLCLGTQEELRTLFKTADDYIGKQLTVKFQSRMTNGCPEFGIGIELDRKDI